MGRVLLKFNPYDNSFTSIPCPTGGTGYVALSFDGTYLWIGRTGPSPFNRIYKRFIHLRKWDFIPGVNISFAIISVGADYTVKDSDNTVLVDAFSGNITITLPTAVGRKGKIFNIKKIDSSANSVIIDPGTQTIDGNSTYTIGTQYESVTLISDNLNWFII